MMEGPSMNANTVRTRGNKKALVWPKRRNCMILSFLSYNEFPNIWSVFLVKALDLYCRRYSSFKELIFPENFLSGTKLNSNMNSSTSLLLGFNFPPSRAIPGTLLSPHSTMSSCHCPSLSLEEAK